MGKMLVGGEWWKGQGMGAQGGPASQVWARVRAGVLRRREVWARVSPGWTLGESLLTWCPGATGPRPRWPQEASWADKERESEAARPPISCSSSSRARCWAEARQVSAHADPGVCGSARMSHKTTQM